MSARFTPRQQFERPIDLKREREIISYMPKEPGQDWVKLPTRYVIDFALVDENDTVLQMAECRWKDSHYREARTASLKIEFMMRMGRIFRMPCHLLIADPTMLRHLQVEQHDWRGLRMAWMGPNNPRDDEDYEPCVEIPSDWWRVLFVGRVCSE